MSSTAITIRTSEDDKKAIDRFARSVGMSTSAFATVVLLQAIHEQQIVLKPKLEPSEELEATLREVEADIKAGSNLSPVFDSAESMFEHMHKERARRA